MRSKKTCVLTIAGFDPSGGAGLLADVKTLEAHGVYGLGVCTAITYQHEAACEGINWLPKENILRQINLLFQQYKIDVAKIGLIENVVVLEEVIDCLKQHNPEIKVIWDPILKASAGFVFHPNRWEEQQLITILRKIYLITPNQEEAVALISRENVLESARYMAQYTSVLLKTSRETTDTISDMLFINERYYEFTVGKISSAAKHGSGCVLSSAIAAHLAKGKALPQACKAAQAYVVAFLQSSDDLLGWHQVVREEYYV